MAALLEAYDLLEPARAPEDKPTITALVDLYNAWQVAEPGNGYDAKAAQWRAKLPEEKWGMMNSE